MVNNKGLVHITLNTLLTSKIFCI